MKYNFYEKGAINIKPINLEFNKINNPFDLYDKLSLIWSKDTCAPRMRDRWSFENKTLGQCSITAFLAQESANVPVIKSTCEDSSIII